jgi:hypothetical protein
MAGWAVIHGEGDTVTECVHLFRLEVEAREAADWYFAKTGSTTVAVVALSESTEQKFLEVMRDEYELGATMRTGLGRKARGGKS